MFTRPLCRRVCGGKSEMLVLAKRVESWTRLLEKSLQSALVLRRERRRPVSQPMPSLSFLPDITNYEVHLPTLSSFLMSSNKSTYSLLSTILPSGKALPSRITAVVCSSANHVITRSPPSLQSPALLAPSKWPCGLCTPNTQTRFRILRPVALIKQYQDIYT